jgi:chromosome segregation ATPase
VGARCSVPLSEVRRGREDEWTMNRDEAAELVEELEALRAQVATLSDTIADCRAGRAHQEAIINRLQAQLRDQRRQRPDATGPA